MDYDNASINLLMADLELENDLLKYSGQMEANSESFKEYIEF